MSDAVSEVIQLLHVDDTPVFLDLVGGVLEGTFGGVVVIARDVTAERGESGDGPTARWTRPVPRLPVESTYAVGPFRRR